MSGVSKEPRAMMAAHLSDLQGIAFRAGHTLRGSNLARSVDMICGGIDRPESVYVVALQGADVPHDEARAAVAAILDGKHPPDSLPGKVARYKGKAHRECEARTTFDDRANYSAGEAHAAGYFLDMLGVKS